MILPRFSCLMLWLIHCHVPLLLIQGKGGLRARNVTYLKREEGLLGTAKNRSDDARYPVLAQLGQNPRPRCGCIECGADVWQNLAPAASNNKNDAEFASSEIHTCGSRIQWLVVSKGMSEVNACRTVASAEFPTECSACDPSKCTPSVRSEQLQPIVTNPSNTCGCRECGDVWDAVADDHACGARIQWLIKSNPKLATKDACLQVSVDEFPNICGACACNSTYSTPSSRPSTEPLLDVPTSRPQQNSTSYPTLASTSTSSGPKSNKANSVVPTPTSRPTIEPFSDVPTFRPQQNSTSYPTLALTPTGSGSSSGESLKPEPEPDNNLQEDEEETTSNDHFTESIVESVTTQRDLMFPVNIDESFIFHRPIPTNRWWTNMIGADPYGGSEHKNFPVYTHPFRLTFNYFQDKDYGLHVCYSRDYRVFLDPSENGSTPRGYIHGHASDFIFSAVEFNHQKPDFRIVGWDEIGLGVSVDVSTTMKKNTAPFEAHGGPDPAIDNSTDGAIKDRGVLSTDLVTGMAFVTVRYRNLVPKLITSHALLSINDHQISTSMPSTSTFTGTKFVTTNNKGQKWVIYSSDTITFQVVPPSILEATSAFKDVTLRMALLPEGISETTYDLYSSCIVTGGSLDVHSDSKYAIRWETKGNCTEGLLHLGFPHHEQVLDRYGDIGGESEGVIDVGLELASPTRGIMRGWATPRLQRTQWKMTEVQEISVSEFLPPRNPNQFLVENFDVLGVLKTEIDQDFALNGNSYYFTGKTAQKYATLCLLASNDAGINEDETLLRTCIEKLQLALDDFLNNNMRHPLVYDEVYRGIVSSEGFASKNIHADFGNTVYNDHHYHYGYWIMTAAVLKKLDPQWTRMPELNEIITLLVRSTANHDHAMDSRFPLFRHFDWFAGHSSSHGLVPFIDGKDQESTSEEMNFHYALMLWGGVSNDLQLQSLGELMIKVGKRSVGQYLMMEDSNKVHPRVVPNKVVGLFFENKVDYTTWFGSRREFIHGIQMIPVSPINEFLRTDTFVREEWLSVLQNLDLVVDADGNRENSWQSLLFANYAVIDKARAMQQLSVATMDPGLSRAWALYFAATRP